MLIIPVIATITLSGLLYAEKTDRRYLVYIFKPITSALFVLAAVLGGIKGTYNILIMFGLIFCFFGDVMLIPKARGWFLFGIMSFLFGHIFYISAFISLVSSISANLLALFLIILVGVITFILLLSHLGNMRVLVMIYIIVISIMLWRSLVVFFSPEVSGVIKFLIPLGATLFYVSDISVAVDRFVKKSFINKLWGLPLYYVGQFLLAFSVIFANA